MKSRSRWLAMGFACLICRETMFSQWSQLSLDPVVYIGWPTDLLEEAGHLYVATNESRVLVTTDNGANWGVLDSGLVDTRVARLASCNGKLFAATQGHGVYRSIDSGKSWVPVNNGLTNLATTCITSNGSDLFVGTWSGGVFVSTDEGQSWTNPRVGMTELNIQSLAASDSLIFAGGYAKLFRSRNNGATWEQVAAGDITSIVFLQDRVFVGTYSNGVIESADGGLMWHPANTGLGSDERRINRLLTHGSHLYVALGLGLGIYYRANGVAAWQEMNAGFEQRSAIALEACGPYLFAGAPSGSHGAIWRRALSDVMSPELSSLPLSVAQCEGSFVVSGTGLSPSGSVRRFVQLPPRLGHALPQSFIQIGSLVASEGGTIQWVYRPDCAHLPGETRVYALDSVTGMTSNVVVQQVSRGNSCTPSLVFPLEDGDPWRTEISSVFDHSMERPYYADGTVVAYNGESGNQRFGRSTPPYVFKVIADDLFGFKDSLGGPFSVYNTCSENCDLLFYDGHPGYDFPAIAGTAVLAAASGRVVETDSAPGRGVYAVLAHANGYSTEYLHLDRVIIAEGDSVTQGATIGYSGNSGSHAQGYHLHFEVHRRLGDGRVVSVDPYGWSGEGFDPYQPGNWNLWQSSPVSVGREILSYPTEPSLFQNYPNPFNLSTVIRYSLSSATQVRITVLNVLGQEVAELVNAMREAGDHAASFRADGLATGVYFCRMSSASPPQLRRMMLLR